MNILPHKSWHVRTKANIARVRKDEAKAAEEEKERQRRIELAESESRTVHLREKAKEKFYKAGGSTASVNDTTSSEKPPDPEPAELPPSRHEHVNLFQDVEEGRDGFKKTNEEHEKEEKEKREKYEKSIGYLTYLGQDTKVTSWYETKRLRDEKPDHSKDEKPNERNDDKSKHDEDEEKQWKDKQRYDPLSIIQKYVGVTKPSKSTDKSHVGNLGKLTMSANNGINVMGNKYESTEAHQGVSTSHIQTKRNETNASSRYKQGFDVEKELRKRRRSVDSDGEYKSKTRKPDSDSDSSHSKYRKRKLKDRRERHRKSHKKRKSKSKKHKKTSSEYSSQYDSEEEKEEKRKQLEHLRQERLKREKEEKARAEKVLAKMRGEIVPDENEEKGEGNGGGRRRKQKYNSQYNPEIAKQNKD